MRVTPEAAVLGDVGRQFVVLTEEDRLAVAHLISLGGKVPLYVQTPAALVGKLGMERGWNGVVGLIPELNRRDSGVVDRIGLGPFHGASMATCGRKLS